jgi:hypothetical protein
MNNHQHERITVLAQDLRLTALPDLYGGIAQNAANKKDVSYADFLEDVLKAERDARRVRSREILTRTAGFPALKTLEAYDFTFATGAPHSQIQELASLGFSSPSRCGPRGSRRWSRKRPPGSRAKSVRTCQGLRPRRADRMLAFAHAIVLPSAGQTASALRTMLSRLNGWPIRSLPTLRVQPRGWSTHGKGSMRIATPSS